MAVYITVFCKPTDTEKFVKSRYSNVFTGFNEDACCDTVDKEASLVSTIFDLDAYIYVKEELKMRKIDQTNISKKIGLLEKQIESIEAITAISGLKVIIDR